MNGIPSNLRLLSSVLPQRGVNNREGSRNFGQNARVGVVRKNSLMHFFLRPVSFSDSCDMRHKKVFLRYLNYLWTIPHKILAINFTQKWVTSFAYFGWRSWTRKTENDVKFLSASCSEPGRFNLISVIIISYWWDFKMLWDGKAMRRRQRNEFLSQKSNRMVQITNNNNNLPSNYRWFEI